MTKNIDTPREEGQIECRTCGAPVWLAVFAGKDRRPVERAPKVRTIVGKILRERFVGHIALTFPLVAGEPILGVVTRRASGYRLHACKAFSAASFDGKKRPTFEAPTVEPIGNVRDLLHGTCTGGDK